MLKGPSAFNKDKGPEIKEEIYGPGESEYLAVDEGEKVDELDVGNEASLMELDSDEGLLEDPLFVNELMPTRTRGKGQPGSFAKYA